MNPVSVKLVVARIIAIYEMFTRVSMVLRSVAGG